MALKQSGRRMWPRVLCFLLIFAVVFFALQEVLRYKYQPEDCWNQRYQDYAAARSESLDVVFIGNSQFYWAVSPMILYNETGITSYNMSCDRFNPILVTEQLKTLLSLNTPPRFVVFSPFNLRQPDAEIELAYYGFVHAQPTLSRSLGALSAFLRRDSAVTLPIYLAPLLRFHSRWNDLNGVDFGNLESADISYQSFLKGQLPLLEWRDITAFIGKEQDYPDVDAVLAQVESDWQDFLALCKENGITLIALIQPRFDSLYQGPMLEAALSWLEEHEIAALNYMDESSLAEMGWNWRRHFADQVHLNFRGSLYFSQDLAYALSDELGLEDHRGEEGFESWDTDVTAFFDAYGSYITGELGDSYAPWWDMEEEIW